MYCGKCGKKLTGKEKFCPRCGSPIPGAGVNTIHKKKRYKARKIFIGVVCILIMAGVGTAIYQSSNDETSSSKIENDVVESEEEDSEESQTVESVSPVDVLSEREPTFTGYAIVTPYIQIILTNEGTVLARGINMYGQLGTGDRLDSDTWVEVKDLDNVVGIYAVGNVGNSRDGEFAYDHIYALTDTGELYRWGGNILTPEKVTFFSTIKAVKEIGNDLFIECESGEKYLITPRYNANHDDNIYSCNSLPNDIQLSASFSDLYLIYSDNQLTLYYTPMFHQYSSESFSNTESIEPIDNYVDRTIPVDISDPIKSMTVGMSDDTTYGVALCTESGNVIFLTYDPYNDDLVTTDLGGSGIKKLYLNDTTFSLFRSGELRAIGENTYGQLGDGTTIDYYDDYLEIDEALFFDFINSSKYCIALDTSYNIWAWGDGFGTTPEIIIENTDFIAE